MDPQSSNGNAQNPENVSRRQEITANLKKKILPGLKISLLLSLLVNFAMFVIGIYGLKKCPVNDYIPLFLIATGLIGVFSKLISIVKDAVNPNINYLGKAESILYTVETVFFVLGSFWVFKVFQPSYYESDGIKYCNKTVYLVAFVYLAIIYAIALAIFFGFLCFLGCMCFVAKTDSDNREPEVHSSLENQQENKQYGTTTGENV